MNILSVSFIPCYAGTKSSQQFHCFTCFSTPTLRAWLHYNFLCCLHCWQVHKVPVWQFLMATEIIHGFSTSKEVSEVQHDWDLCASTSWFYFLHLHCIFQHSEIQKSLASFLYVGHWHTFHTITAWCKRIQLQFFVTLHFSITFCRSSLVSPSSMSLAENILNWHTTGHANEAKLSNLCVTTFSFRIMLQFFF